MVNPVSSIPIQFNGNDLTFGEVTLPEARTFTSFWTGESSDDVVLHRSDQDEYATIYRLYLENGANKQAAISYLLENTNMEANFILIRRIVLINPKAKKDVDDEKEAPNPTAIRFEFSSEAVALRFQKYIAPTLSDKPLKSGSLGFNGRHFVTLPLTDEKDPIQRIKDVFARIKQRFGDSGIKHALRTLNDERLKPEPNKTIENHDLDWRWDHQRHFNVHRNGIQEQIDLAPKVKSMLNISSEAIRQWLADPASYRGKGRETFKAELTSCIEQVNELGLSEEKILSLVAAVESIPGFGEEFLRTHHSKMASR